MQVEKLQNASNQIQKEIQYFVFQDLENALCQIAQLEETIEKLEKEKNHPYLPIAMNKAILQANLSLGIHFDQYTQHNNKEGFFLKNCKSIAKSIFQEALKQKIIQNVHPKVKAICDFYIKNLFGDTKIYTVNELKLEKVETKAQFNQKALEQVIWGTQAVDKQLSKVQNNEYKPPDAQEIFNNVKIYKKSCGEQLIKNILKPANNNSTQKKQEQKQKQDYQLNKKNKQEFFDVKKVCIEGKQAMDEEFDKEEDQFKMETQNSEKELKQNKQVMQQEEKKQQPTLKHENSNPKPLPERRQISQIKITQPIACTKGAQNNQQNNKTQGVNQSIKKK